MPANTVATSGQDGRRLVHKKLPCDLAAILQLLAPYKDRVSTIAVESTFNWYWLVDGLQDHGYHVALANAAGNATLPRD